MSAELRLLRRDRLGGRSFTDVSGCILVKVYQWSGWHGNVLADVRNADGVDVRVVEVGAGDDVLVVMDGIGDVERLLVRL